MIALQVQDIKSFMSKLLIGTDFDAFWLSEANITTSVTYTIDGLLHPDFFDTQEAELLQAEGREYALWKDIKPLCFSIMKGKKHLFTLKLYSCFQRKIQKNFYLEIMFLLLLTIFSVFS